MTTTFKPILPNDVVSTRTMLHEAIPVTGSIVSGTYTNYAGSEWNIKTFAHGMFESVYDYPYLSSSANHILDLSVGLSTRSESLSASTDQMIAKKVNIYNEMAQVLVGFDHTGSVRPFDRDGNLATGAKLDDVFFVNFTRLLTKDEIKKGSFQMSLYTGSTAAAPAAGTGGSIMTIYDADVNKYLTNSPAGEYTLLHTSSTGGANAADVPVGLLYYQAGIAVLTASVFSALYQGTDVDSDGSTGYFGTPISSSDTVTAVLTGSTIEHACDGLRNRIKNIQFNNTTELNSTVYFCRANHLEFNYSSNPTYLSASTIRVKNDASDIPISYVTSVGLYSADNELLATAKLSEPLRKDSNNEFTLRVRLDY